MWLMPFTMPNDVVGGTTKQHAQATPDSVDIDILVAGHNLTGVQSGCAVTAQGTPDMTLAVASGTVGVAGVAATVAAGNVTVTSAHASLPRFDLVVVSSAGVKSVTAGTPAAAPVFPAIPANSVVLAAVYVGAAVTVIATADIVDKRVILNSTTYAPASAAWTALTVYKANQIVTNGGVVYQAKVDFTSGSVFDASNWNAISAPAASTATYSARTTRTAGDVAVTNSTWAAFSSSLDITLNAVAGNWIAVMLNFGVSSQNCDLFWDVGTIVSAAVVNSVSGLALSGSSTRGLVGLWCPSGSAGTLNSKGTTMLYQVAAGDLVAGQIVLRPYVLMVANGGVVSRTVFANSNTPFLFGAVNLG